MSNSLTTNYLYDCGAVKRADLRLRTKYYGLTTQIYLLENHHYGIQIINYIENYSIIKEDFDQNISPLSSWIDLIKEKPSNFLDKIDPLTNIAYNNEGLFLNHKMFESLLISKFPNIDFIKTTVDHNQGINLNVVVSEKTKENDINLLKEFIINLKNGFTNVNVTKDFVSKKFLHNSDVNLSCTDKKFKFSVRDSEFWFDNVEKIYSGNVTKKDLVFYNPKTTKCYLNFSVWNNENINLRSNMLLYDETYISLPLGSHVNDFFDHQNLTIKDLEEIVERNKLIIFLPNTESRYDEKLIKRLYDINNSSIVSKRGINALMAINYYDLEKKYLSFWKGNEDILKELCIKSINSEDKNLKNFLKWLMWPIKAKNESYELLTSYSPMKLPIIGANTLFDFLDKNSEASNDINFELTVNSNAIHIASALQATYFPFYMKGENGHYSDSFSSNLLGDIINAYQYPEKFQQENIKNYADILDKDKHFIHLLDTDNSIDLKHIIDYSDKYKTTISLKKILENLSELPESDRRNKINEYNNLIAEIGKEQFNIFKSGFSYILTGAGLFPGIGTAASIISLLLQLVKDSKIIEKNNINNLENKTLSSKESVYLLDKISRIAKIHY